MSSNYEEICQENIRRRGEEFDDIGQLISEQLYSERGHFIYELLQNAEDAIARRKRKNPKDDAPTSVKFILYEDKLEFRHFGDEFNTDDVRAITDILRGTKSKDKDQIGKFGIGFKSVYAFTSTPEVHSGDEHFLIERYIRPRAAKKLRDMKDKETVFIFPFNHRDLSKDEAFSLISDKLRKISARVLLFLNHITEIEWTIKSDKSGVYLKESRKCDNIASRVILAGQYGEKLEYEEWLVFKRAFENPDSLYRNIVEVAFRVMKNEKSGKEMVVKTSTSPLVVYFSTGFETRLGFLVQGPFETTASRANIKDNDWNRRLVDETTALLIETVLPWMRDKRLLGVNFFETLPLVPEYFPQESLFRPMYEKLRIFFKKNDFLPTSNNSYISGEHAVLARGGELAQLFNQDQITELLGSSDRLDWLTTEITDSRTEIYRYLVGYRPGYWDRSKEEIKPLIVAEIRPEDIVERLTANFLEKQSDSWLIKLYHFLKKRTALTYKLKTVPIIRLEDGRHVEPFKKDGSPNAYLPPDTETNFPIVSRKIVEDEEALEFLRNLGLKEPDIFAEIDQFVVPKYDKESPEVSDEEHIEDLKKILNAFITDSPHKNEFISRMKNKPFILAENIVKNKVEYRKPEDVYFKKDELLIYFEGNENIWFLSDIYNKKLRSELDKRDIGEDKLTEFFRTLGVRYSVKVIRRQPSENGYVVIENNDGLYRRGLNGFDPGVKVDGIQYAVKNPTLERSKIVWNEIAVRHSDCIQGTVLTSSRRDFSPHASTYMEDRLISEFGKLLINNAWIPDKQGVFHTPEEIGLDDLPEGFIRDEKLADQLGMKKDVIAKLAQETGIPLNKLDQFAEIMNHFKNRPEYIDTVYRHIKKPEFTSKELVNPERREEKIQEQWDESPKKEYEKRNRSVRTSSNSFDEKTYLRDKYTNIEGKMVCQICKEEMPFKKRNGQYYFEAVEAFSGYYFTKEHEAQFLALCPVCAAKYKEFIKSEEEEMASLRNAILNSEKPEVPIQLGEEKATLRFEASHFLDIKTILKNEMEQNTDK